VLDQRIAELELRIQRDRQHSRLRTRALLTGMRDSLTSPLSLAIAAGTGFAVHRFNLLHRPRPEVAAGAKPGISDSLLSGMIRTFTLTASLIALLPDAPAPRPNDPSPSA
jgi:hypothetical protein